MLFSELFFLEVGLQMTNLMFVDLCLPRGKSWSAENATHLYSKYSYTCEKYIDFYFKCTFESWPAVLAY